MTFLLLKKITELFLVMLMGYILAKKGIVEPNDSKILSKITLYLVMPCVIIQAFQVQYTEQIRNGLLLALVAAILIHIVLLILIQIFGKMFSLDPVEKMSVMYSNAANLIIPIVTAILGNEWVIYSSAFIVVQLMFLWTHGRILVSDTKKIDIKGFLLNINFISIGVGLILFIFHIQLPSIISGTFSSVGSMVGPFSMLIAGILFAGVDIKEILRQKRLYIVVFLRMIVFPLCILTLLKVCKLEYLVSDGRTILLISFLAAMTPTAATVTQMAQVYSEEGDKAGGIYVITTLLSIFTMPVFVMLYEHF